MWVAGREFTFQYRLFPSTASIARYNIPITLFASPISGHFQQVRITLRAKGLAFTKVSPACLGVRMAPDPGMARGQPAQ